jgi:hypothetical protein
MKELHNHQLHAELSKAGLHLVITALPASFHGAPYNVSFKRSNM